MFCRAERTTSEPVAGSVHRLRRTALVSFGRRVRRGTVRVDPDQAHEQNTVFTDPSHHQPVPRVSHGAAQPGAEQRSREVAGPVHRAVRVHHGHQSPGGHGQVPELSKVRTERGHYPRVVRHRFAGNVGFHKSRIAVRVGRQSAVRENDQPVHNHQKQVSGHTGRGGQRKGNNNIVLFDCAMISSEMFRREIVNCYHPSKQYHCFRFINHNKMHGVMLCDQLTKILII